MKTDVLIIGGGPAGMVAAATARKNNPDKKITLVREKEREVIPCGVPYIFNRLDSVEKNLIADDSLEKNKINLIIKKAIRVNSDDKKVFLEGNEELNYGKLILAVGSQPILIPIKGIDKKGVWQIKKDFEYLKNLREAVLKSRRVVIIGGGFIGVELAEELSNIDGLDVALIEKADHCLATIFDEEFAVSSEEKIKQKGVKIYVNTIVKEIAGKDQVEFVKLDSQENIPADLVILSIGAQPNIDLIKGTGVKIGENKGIQVDEYMKTSVKDIFAIGDCAETKCLLTKKCIPIMLASTACHEARIAAANLYKETKLIKNRGTLGGFSTFLGGLALGAVGLNEQTAQAQEKGIIVGIAEAKNHHPGTLPNTQTIKVKLVFSKTSKILLGGQIEGPESVGEMINIIALAIQQKMNIYDFNTLQIATHPLLTAAPTVYPLIAAAQAALAKLK